MITIKQQMESRRPLALRELGCWMWMLRKLTHSGITPNQVSVLGVVFGLAAGGSLALTPFLTPAGPAQRIALLAAILLIILRGACNIFDGVLALETGRASRLGLLYNEVPDRISDIGIFLGAGFAIGSHPLLGLAAALGSVITAYVRVQVQLAGAGADYCGPMAKPTRMLTLCLAAGALALLPGPWWPTTTGGLGLIGLTLALITLGTGVTAVIRLRHAATELRTSPQHDHG